MLEGLEVKSSEVASAVRRHYGCDKDPVMGTEWSCLSEFSLRPGGGNRRIDMMMVRSWGGKPKGHERHAIEIKVSRSDLKNELARPSKRAPFEAVAHRFWFATPKGLCEPDDLPDGCGLLVVTGNTVRKVRQAERRVPDGVSELMFVEAFRRAGRAETRIRTASEGDADDLAARVADLEKRLQQSEGRLAPAKEKLRLERSATRTLVEMVRGLGPVTCECGNGHVVVKSIKEIHYRGVTWEAVGEPCCNWPRPDADALTALVLGDR